MIGKYPVVTDEIRDLGYCGSYLSSIDISYGSIFGKRALLAIDHIMLALFWSYVPNMK